MLENRFPKTLRSLNELEFDYLDGEGIGFEPYRRFLSREEANHWLLAQGVGPCEFVVYGTERCRECAIFESFAHRHAKKMSGTSVADPQFQIDCRVLAVGSH